MEGEGEGRRKTVVGRQEEIKGEREIGILR